MHSWGIFGLILLPPRRTLKPSVLYVWSLPESLSFFFGREGGGWLLKKKLHGFEFQDASYCSQNQESEAEGVSILRLGL